MFAILSDRYCLCFYRNQNLSQNIVLEYICFSHFTENPLRKSKPEWISSRREIVVSKSVSRLVSGCEIIPYPACVCTVQKNNFHYKLKVWNLFSNLYCHSQHNLDIHSAISVCLIFPRAPWNLEYRQKDITGPTWWMDKNLHFSLSEAQSPSPQNIILFLLTFTFCL